MKEKQKHKIKCTICGDDFYTSNRSKKYCCGECSDVARSGFHTKYDRKRLKI